MGEKLIKGFRSIKKNGVRKIKYEINRIENVLVQDRKGESLENKIDEVAQIIYSHICQLTQIDSLSLKNLTGDVHHG